MNPIDALRLALRRLAQRAVVLLVKAGGPVLLVQVRPTAHETVDNVEVLEHVGHWAHPLPGAEVVLLSLGGNRELPFAMGVADRRHRPRDLQAGETAFGNCHGSLVYFRAGVLHVKPAAGVPVLFEAPAGVEFQGPVTFREAVSFEQAATFEAAIMSQGKDVGAGHHHQNSGAGPVA